MRAVCILSVVVLLAPSAQAGQGPPATPAAPFYAVSYVEVEAAASGTAVAALDQYRRASGAIDGFVQVELFEQVGRPGHFAVIEVWRDQQAFDAGEPPAQQSLLAALEAVRVSGYDQRPYKVLDVQAARATGPGVLFVISHVDVSPDPKVPDLLRGQAAASRQEAGNLRFDVVQHTMRGNHFTVIEAWRDQQALDAHVAAGHTRRYRDALQPFTGSPLDERLYRVVN